MDVRAKIKREASLKLIVMVCGAALTIISMPERNIFAGGYSLEDLRSGLTGGISKTTGQARVTLGGIYSSASQIASPYLNAGREYLNRSISNNAPSSTSTSAIKQATGWIGRKKAQLNNRLSESSKGLQQLKGKATQFINNNSSLNVSANKFYQKQVMSPWLSPLANMLNTAKNYKDKASAMWNKFSQRVSGVYARTNPPTPSSNLLLFSVGGVLSSARTNPGASQNNNTQISSRNVNSNGDNMEGASVSKGASDEDKEWDALAADISSSISTMAQNKAKRQAYKAERRQMRQDFKEMKQAFALFETEVDGKYSNTTGAMAHLDLELGGKDGTTIVYRGPMMRMLSGKNGKQVSAAEKFLIDMRIGYRAKSSQVKESVDNITESITKTSSYQAAKASLVEAGNTISGAVTTVTTTTNSASNTVSNLYGIQKHYENIGRKTVDKGIRQAYNDVVNYIKPNPDNQNNAPTKNVRKMPVFRERTVAKQRAYEPNRMWNSKEGKWDYSMILVETTKGENVATGKKETWRSFYQPGKKNPYFVEKVSPRKSSVVPQQQVTSSKTALNATNLTGAPAQLVNLTTPGNVSTPLSQTNVSVASEKIKYNPAPEGKFNVSDSLQLIADSKAVVDTKNNTVTSMRVDPKTHRMYWVKENRGQGNATAGERIEGPVYKETARTAVLSDLAGWAIYQEGAGTSAETRNPDGTPFSNTGSRVTYEDFINQITNKLQDTTKVKLDSGEEFSVQSVVFSKPIMSSTGISEYAERLSGVVTTDGRFIPNSLISTGVTSSGASYNYVVPRTLSPGAKGKK